MVPEGVTRALAKGATDRGAVVVEGVRVDDVILGGGEPVGHTTSGAFGPTLGAAVAMGYVGRPDGGEVTRGFVEGGEFEILNDGARYWARACLGPPFDPGRGKILGGPPGAGAVQGAASGLGP